MTTTSDDLQLLARWLSDRDQRAVGELWTRHQRLGVVVAARILSGCADPYEEGRDIFDDCFLKALRTFRPERASPDARNPFRTWLLKLIRFAAIDRKRRLGRLQFGDVPEGVVYPQDDGLALSYDVREVIPRLRAFVLEKYLPVDWMLFERWMEYKRDERRVPWKSLANEFPIDIHEIVSFPPGSADLADPEGLAPIVHTMDVCPAIQVQVTGYRDGQEDTDLARRRAEVVQRALQERITKKVLVERKTRKTEPRLVIAEREGGSRVEFEVTRGRLRSPDALRMRIQKVILRRARELIERDKQTGTAL